MPKDEFDLDDPMELNGVGLVCEEDTTDEMAECFIEEFMRLGYNHKQILALFRNPYYLGMNLVLVKRGEPFVRERIAEVFARRGRVIEWPAACSGRGAETRGEAGGQGCGIKRDQSLVTSAPTTGFEGSACDPMGGAIPELDL
jgi:hypothetical protein